MTARSALHTAGAVTGAPDARLAQAAGWFKNGITPRTGVVYAGASTLLTATATMQVSVAALHFVGSKADQQGLYLGANDGAYLLTIAAAPGSGSRTDTVYIMQQDSNAGTTSPDATTAPLIAATSGALPAGAVAIGTVVVPAGTTALTDAGVVITTTCRWTATAGAPVPVRNTTERAALTAFNGLRVQRLDQGGVIDRYNGSAWVDGDSGWVDADTALQTGWTESGSYALQVRKIGTQVMFRGAVVRGSGAGASVLVIPVGYRPGANQWLAAQVASGGEVVNCNASTSGTIAIQYQTTGVAVGSTLPLFGVWTTD